MRQEATWFHPSTEWFILDHINCAYQELCLLQFRYLIRYKLFQQHRISHEPGKTLRLHLPQMNLKERCPVFMIVIQFLHTLNKFYIFL